MARLGRGQPNRPITSRPRVTQPGGTGVITGTAMLAGTGTKNAVGSGTITGTVTLTGTGRKNAYGTATITGVVELSGTGDKQSGIGSIPRPRIRWQFVVGPAGGGHELALTEARGRRFTARLTDPSEVSYSIDGRHPQAAAIDELTTDTHVLWTPDAGQTRIVMRGRNGNTGDTLDSTSHQMDVAALDYRAVLNRRRLYSTNPLTYTATDQAEIVWGLISATQGNTAGGLGLSKGWTGTTPTGVLRDRTYEAGDSVGERIQELSEVIGGFDWDVEADSASALQVNVYYPQRGVNRGVVLEYGGLIAGARREVNVGDYANAIRMTGEETLVAQELEATDLADRPEGRWDAVFGDAGLTTQPALNDRALWQIAESQVVQPTYTLTLVQDAWDGPDHIWLGDWVQVVIISPPRLQVNDLLRVYEMQFSIGENGEEALELTVGGPKPDPRRRAAQVNRRLKNLERR
ncbi:hypothetical protein GCM10023085_45310 [Actinomadura viridis]